MKTKMDVKIRMLQLGLTQEKMANELGVCRTSVVRVMNGKDRTPRTRLHIAHKLGVPLGRLARALDWPDAPGRKPAPAAPEKEAVA